MTEKLKQFIKEYATVLKRGLLLVGIFLMLIAIQTLVNYTAIIENTKIIEAQTAKVQEEIDYINNYQLKFLDSDHAKIFLSHENNILRREEVVVAFKEPQAKEEEIANTEAKEQLLSPREERKIYRGEKFNQ